MISLLHGTILDISGKELTLLTSGGVGYKIVASPAAIALCLVGQPVTLTTHLVVREDALELYGFKDKAECNLFKHFLSVSGVGPKTAVQLLALGSASDIATAVNRGDIDYLTAVSGIGKKTAERIILELRSKLKDEAILSRDEGGTRAPGDPIGEVIDALIGLGYSIIEAREVVKKLDTKGKTSEQLLKAALQSIR